MRVRDLAGWPPAEIECNEPPDKTDRLVIESVTFIPGYRSSGDTVLVLVDRENSIECTARLKFHDVDLAMRTLEVLTRCRGLTVKEAGLRAIPDGRDF